MNMLIDRLKNLNAFGIAALIAVPVICGLILFFVAARTINTTPSQCASCHPEITSLWKESKAHPANRVTCYECHAQHPELPNKFNVFAYVRDLLIPEKYLSSDQRVEEKCVGCHGDVIGATAERGKLIKVNHRVHLEKPVRMGDVEGYLGCVDCHSAVAHDRRATATNRPTMEGCFTSTCHVKDRNADSCLRCHYQKLIEPTIAKAGAPEATGEATR